MSRRRPSSEPPREVDWSVYAVHPSHPRPKDVCYHDVMEALSKDEPRSMQAVRQHLLTIYPNREISRALKLLVLDEFARKEGNKYVLL